jgi:hypothetical protein
MIKNKFYVNTNTYNSTTSITLVKKDNLFSIISYRNLHTVND